MTYLFITGCLSIVAGVFLLSVPAALIVAGFLAAACAVLRERGK
jgi:hypothetical protein